MFELTAWTGVVILMAHFTSDETQKAGLWLS